MKEKFKTFKLEGSISINLGEEKGVWSANKADLLNAIKEVCEKYQAAGHTLTLRQMYYQLVSKDYIPNHDKVYKKLSSLKDELLYAGLLDWSIFVDRGRVPSTAYTEKDIPSALKRTLDCYNLNKQDGQPNHIEVWTEKDAISGILANVTEPYTVTLVVNKGYTSSTAIYDSYRRFIKKIKAGQKITILYFGDHDPSGLDMVRDITERLMFMFVNGTDVHHWSFEEIVDKWIKDTDTDWLVAQADGDLVMSWYDGDFFNKYRFFFSYNFQVIPIGLTMEQIKKYNPPPNPAKITDPRAGEYVKKFGQKSWEVDALDPDTMMEIVEDKIKELMNIDIYNMVLETETREKQELEKIIESLKN